MRRLLTAVDAQDACIIAGVLLIGVGAGMVYVPAGLVVVGVLMLALALWRM
jgi:hypothetical protein